MRPSSWRERQTPLSSACAAQWVHRLAPGRARRGRAAGAPAGRRRLAGTCQAVPGGAAGGAVGGEAAVPRCCGRCWCKRWAGSVWRKTGEGRSRGAIKPCSFGTQAWHIKRPWRCVPAIMPGSDCAPALQARHGLVLSAGHSTFASCQAGSKVSVGLVLINTCVCICAALPFVFRRSGALGGDSLQFSSASAAAATSHALPRRLAQTTAGGSVGKMLHRLFTFSSLATSGADTISSLSHPGHPGAGCEFIK